MIWKIEPVRALSQARFEWLVAIAEAAQEVDSTFPLIPGTIAQTAALRRLRSLLEQKP